MSQQTIMTFAIKRAAASSQQPLAFYIVTVQDSVSSWSA